MVEGLGALQKTLHVNVYQFVNCKDNYESMRSVLDNVYALARWASVHGHTMILSGDLNATLLESHRVNYADTVSLLPGDSLLRDCFTATGASAVSGSDAVTWKSKSGQQEAVLDHIWYWPASLREVSSGVEWRADSRFDHAIKWAEFNGNDVGFGTLRDTTRTPFRPKLKLTTVSYTHLTLPTKRIV